jgi:hypothetical protein
MVKPIKPCTATLFAYEDDHMTNVLLSRIRDPESDLTRGIREP